MLLRTEWISPKIGTGDGPIKMQPSSWPPPFEISAIGAMKKLSFLLLITLASSLTGLAQSYGDPVAYCRAVGTIDRPDSRYTGPKLPGWMALKLNLRPDQGALMEWRCAHRKVLACLYGANIPCGSKANASRNPTPAIAGYCRENPGSSFVPMVVTGHETTISWACHGTKPVVIRRGAVDSQGFAKTYWKEVSP